LVKSAINNIQPDYLVLFGTSIIGEPLLKKYSERIINLHLGLSPYYKGSATNLFPFYYNEPECIGATIHLATSKVDDGPVLHQLRPDIEPEDDLHSIGNKTILKAGKILPEVIKAFSEKKIIPQKQTGTGLNCRNKDLTPALLRTVYDNLEEGMLPEYLQHKKFRDGEKPIVKM
jgi:folate-dependent phosphoribosylglycinamide formyltransferase PurN